MKQCLMFNQICHSKHTRHHTSHLCMNQKTGLTIFILYHSFLFFIVSFYTVLVGQNLHKAFLLPPLKPSHLPLPGIPEPTLAIQNVKNEEKAQEGKTTTTAGRVLSHCTDIPQPPRVVVAQNAWGFS